MDGNNLITIRDFKAQETQALRGVALDAFEQFKQDYNNWPYIKSIVAGLADLQYPNQVLVAEYRHQLAGGVALVPAGTESRGMEQGWAVMRLLVVSPRFRSKGIGKALASACIQRAKDKGYSTIGLFTSPLMKVALPMYLRMGFEKVREIEPIGGVKYAAYKLDLDTLSINS